MQPQEVIADYHFINQLKRHEGSKKNATGHHVAYRCTAGALTIGYGHNLDAHPLAGVDEKSKLTAARATEILAADVQAVADEVLAALPWVTLLDGPRLAVVLNMAFNLGTPKLLTFTTFLTATRQARWQTAKTAMLDSRWATQVKGRAVELARQMESGLWTNVPSGVHRKGGA